MKTVKVEYQASCDECICELVAYNSGLQMAHWLADTSSNEHKTLGELYDSMISLTDQFAEVYMGKYGLIKPQGKPISMLGDKPASEGCEIVYKLEAELNPEDDADLLNITADMHTALYKAKYLLKE